jgi:hypothetical protein
VSGIVTAGEFAKSTRISFRVNINKHLMMQEKREKNPK